VGKKKGKGKGKGKGNAKRGEEEEEALESGADKEEEEWQGCDEEGEEEQQWGGREDEEGEEGQQQGGREDEEGEEEQQQDGTEDEEVDELESSACATPAPEEEPCYLAKLRRPPTSPMKRWLADLTPEQRAFKIWDWNAVNDYEYEIEKNKARNRDLLTTLDLEQATARTMGTQSTG
jgi:hypothetical protein